MGIKEKLKQAAESDHAKDIEKGAKDLIKTPAVKEILGASAAGALIGVVVPIVGPVMGAQAGAIYGVYRAITKES